MTSATGAPPRACRRCIMNEAAEPAITFDETGLCSHCRRYDELKPTRVLVGEAGRAALEQLTGRIRAAGKGREYDCVVGVSGGVDSTYTAYLVKKLGLRPLAVHFDNGWDSELAVSNIEKVLKRLEIDLHTYVVDWEEFRDLQIAFLEASTPDGEIPSDHAIFALLWKEAAARGIKFVVSGMNFTTEAMSVPDWAYGHSDWRYIQDVHRRFGRRPLRTYPHFSLPELFWINLVRGVRTVSFLNYLEYRRDEVLRVLQEELGWVYYGGKHYESVYTRFWQGHVLPRKFGIDKRIGHYSDLINAGQMTREEALVRMQEPPYPLDLQEADREYVIKKLELDPREWERIMALPRKTYRDYRNQAQQVARLKRMVNALRQRGLYGR